MRLLHETCTDTPSPTSNQVMLFFACRILSLYDNEKPRGSVVVELKNPVLVEYCEHTKISLQVLLTSYRRRTKRLSLFLLIHFKDTRSKNSSKTGRNLSNVSWNQITLAVGTTTRAPCIQKLPTFHDPLSSRLESLSNRRLCRFDGNDSTVDRT
jgi:hypothetical protein